MPHECERYEITEVAGIAWRRCVECGRKEKGRLVTTNVAGGPESEALRPRRREEA